MNSSKKGSQGKYTQNPGVGGQWQNAEQGEVVPGLANGGASKVS
jgi:hypothetical protein